jgi:hypothetical protein
LRAQQEVAAFTRDLIGGMIRTMPDRPTKTTFAEMRAREDENERLLLAMLPANQIGMARRRDEPKRNSDRRHNCIGLLVSS